MKIETEDIQKLVETQNNWRGRECLNLIASENAQSPMVRSCLLYTSPSPRDGLLSRMPSSA